MQPKPIGMTPSSVRPLVTGILNRLLGVCSSGDGGKLVLDRENFLSVQFDLYKRLIFLRKPKSIYVLKVANEVDAFYPERKFLCGMPGNANDGVVSSVNPYFSFKQILVGPFWHGPDDEAAIRADLLLAKKFKGVIGRGDGTIRQRLSGGCFDFTGDQLIESQPTHDSDAHFRTFD